MQLPADSPQSVYDLFSRQAARVPQRAFLCVLPETAQAYGIAAGEVTYGEAHATVERLRAAYAAAGYRAGQRVAMLLENRPAYFLHWFALNALGVSGVPLNPDMRAAELEYVLGHSDAVGVVAIPARHTGLRAAAKAIGRAIPVFDPDDAPQPPFVGEVNAPDTGRDAECALLYTSGTTGKPKGCVLPNEYFLYAGHWYATAGGLIVFRDDGERMLTPLPVFHMNAMAYSAMAMLAVGGCLIPLDRFHPKTWWQSVRDSRASIVHYLGVMPPMLMGTPESKEDRSHNVRFGFGAGVDRALHAPFEQRFGFPLIEAWAMTETGAGAVVVAAREPRHVGTSCFGRPGPELETRIVDEADADVPRGEPGELLVRHAGGAPRYGFFRCYLKDPDATAQAWAGDWFHTGDVVRQDADGAMHFVDRRKNVIRRSGENISAVEVESVLMQHPAVRQVAVAPVADPVRGDEVFACIVTHQPAADRAARERVAGEIVAWCLTRLAYYKAPGYVGFVPEIALTSTQKIQRGNLKDMVAGLVGGDACVDTRALKRRTAA